MARGARGGESSVVAAGPREGAARRGHDGAAGLAVTAVTGRGRGATAGRRPVGPAVGRHCGRSVGIQIVSCELEQIVPAPRPVHFSRTFVGTWDAERSRNPYLAV